MRIHYWSFLLNEEGQPVENAEIWVYQAGTTIPADLYASETGVYSVTPYQVTFNSYENGTASEIIKTDENGYFEFWLGDASEPNGYTTSQKFRIKWYKAGILEGEIDNINIIVYSDGQGLNWKGAWTVDTLYSEYDLVTNGENGYLLTYVCISSNNSSTLSEPSSGDDWEFYWEKFSTGSTLYSFLSLDDTPDVYSSIGALYNVNAGKTGVAETSVILAEDTNTFSLTNGTASLDIATGTTLDVNADFTVESTSIVNQDLTTDADVTFATLTLSAGQIDIDEISNDITLADASSYAIPTEYAVKTYVDTNIIAHDSFLELNDTPSSYSASGAIYKVSNDSDAIEESSLILGQDTNTFSLTNGTASLDIAVGSTLNIDKDFTVDGFGTTITGAGQANTIILNESFTIGDGNDGTLTYSGASKTLTVEDTSIVNQDLTTDADVTFATLTLSAGAVDINKISNDGTLVDNSEYSIPTEYAVKTYVDTQVESKDVFLELNDTPSSYSASGAIYTVNNDADAVRESTLILGQDTNTFSLTNGTASLNVNAGLTVESTSIVNQDLTTDASVTFATLTLSAGAVDINEISVDGTLGGNSPYAIPTEYAVKTYVDATWNNIEYNNSDTTINLTTSDFTKTLLINNASAVTINLPSVDSSDIGRWIKIHKMGTGDLTINRADADVVEDGTSVANTISTETWANITIFLGTATIWKFDGSPLGTWVTS